MRSCRRTTGTRREAAAGEGGGGGGSAQRHRAHPEVNTLTTWVGEGVAVRGRCLKNPDFGIFQVTELLFLLR